jgi:hypothetical protein
MRLATDGREDDEDLSKPPIEGRRLGRPEDGLGPVPERLGLVRIDEEQGIAEVAQRSVGDGMDLRLMAE